jgi:hypothetical protein
MTKTTKRPRSKIFLPNGCWCSKPNVSPQNWNDKKDKTVTTEKDWCIQYRFYDPSVVDDKGKVKPHHEVFKKMNDLKSLSDRRAVCEEMLKNEEVNLKNGYNPAKGKFIQPFNTLFEINPDTPFIKAFSRCWYSTPIFAPLLAVVVSIDQQRIALKYLTKKSISTALAGKPRMQCATLTNTLYNLSNFA